jgi:hypothetical protein
MPAATGRARGDNPPLEIYARGAIPTIKGDAVTTLTLVLDYAAMGIQRSARSGCTGPTAHIRTKSAVGSAYLAAGHRRRNAVGAAMPGLPSE